ncbi:hypothetical protein GA0070606_0750 [Micromonospora citrea]|uniref:Uncharacterized protein n=1 Tax=Micromonospora citrea TaxID=47855 RepID=A0A1C6TV26_9ACTN|nr:hypothetical protein [Micromonospora citrea]SCL45451.1 hypothetical protein GA0070606_0750 [Micromonospora citrea]
MTFRRSERPADRAESDRLLDAARTPDAAEPESLARLLSAAAAPARPGELAGEEAALAAFRAARAAAPGTAVAAPRPPRGRRFTAGAVAWAAGVVVTATAGAAFAAVTLDRPDEPTPSSPRPSTPAPATTEPQEGGSTDPTGGGAPSGTPTDAPASPSGAPTSGAVTPPGPPGGRPGGGPRSPEQRTEQLRGLCRSYLAQPAAQREKTLDTSAFAGLVTAAGGREAVDGFCRELVPDAEPQKSRRVGPTALPTP